MSPLMVLVAVSTAAMGPCRGDDTEVPVRLVGWSDEDAASLRTELAAWVTERDRTACEARERDEALTLTLLPLEANIGFTLHGRTRTRDVSRGDDVALFRYQVAVAAEELVRSTWERPPPPLLGLHARADFEVLGGGQWFAGGGVGGEVFLQPWLSVQLFALAAGLKANPLDSGGTVGGARYAGALSVSALPVQLGALVLGAHATVLVGAAVVSVSEPGSPGATSVVPWVETSAGLAGGLVFRRASVTLFADATFVEAGAAVELEGVRVQRIGGFGGTFGVQGAWLW